MLFFNKFDKIVYVLGIISQFIILALLNVVLFIICYFIINSIELLLVDVLIISVKIICFCSCIFVINLCYLLYRSFQEWKSYQGEK